MPQNPFDTIADSQLGQPATAPKNPFDDILAQQENDQRRRMIAAQKQSEGSTPDGRAESIKLGRQTGLPAAVVESNLEDVRGRVGGLPLANVQKQTPAVAEWATNPDHAAVARDDMENLGALEWLLKAPSRAFAQQLNSLRYSELRVKQMFGTLSTEENDRMNSYKHHSDLGGDLGVKDSWFAKAVTGAGRLLAQSVDPAKYAIVGGIETAAVGAAGGSVLPGGGTVAGAIGGFGYGAKAGLAYGVFKSATMQETAGTYDEILTMRDETGAPMDPEVAKMAAITVGGISGVLEGAGVQSVLKRFPALEGLRIGARKEAVKQALKNPTVRASLKAMAKNYVGGISTEVATEIAQRGVSILGQEVAKLADGGKIEARSAGDTWDDLVETGLSSIPEFALGLAPGPMQSFARDVAKAKSAEQSVQFFTALGEGVTQSKTAQRLPEAFERLVDDATKDGPVKSVFIPTEAWRTYWQSQDIDADAMATEVTGRPNALQDADVHGNLEVPMSRYASRVAGSEHHAALLLELRLGNPDAMNGREVEDFKANIQAERDKVTAARERAEEQAEARDIQRQVEDQLVESGNVPRETARTAAQQLHATVTTLSERAGFDPAETYAGLGLEIVRRPAAEVVGQSGLAQPESPTVPVQGAESREEIPGLAELEASLGGATLSPVADQDGLTLNASGESAASAEALSRSGGMRSRGESFVVYDRAGRRRNILGPDAVDYVARQGETYGVEGPGGFRVLDDRGGRRPSSGASGPAALGDAFRGLLRQSAALPGVKAGVRVDGELGAPSAGGDRAHFAGYQPGGKWMPTHALYTIVGGEQDGSTVGAERLEELGIPLPPTPPLLELFQAAEAASPEFGAWFGNSVVVDEDGKPLVVFHGTTQSFSSFMRERANIESDHGAGFYFSNTPDDVAANYADVGPDLKSKIERAAERIEQELEEDDSLTPDERRGEAMRQATEQFVEHGGMTMPVFLKIENPAVLGGEQETRLTYEEEFEALDEFDEADVNELRDEGMSDDEIRRELSDRNRYEPVVTGTLGDFIDALRRVASRFDDADVSELASDLFGRGFEGDLTVREAIEIAKAHEGLSYAQDENGDLAVNEILRQALQEAGYDGIIDHTVDIKFGSQRRVGQSMQGMDEETVHYIVFEPTQIKSAIGNSGRFDPLSADILFQPADAAMEAMEPARGAFYSRVERTVLEAKQNKGTGAQWKGIIKNSKLGVNRDEFAITRIDELEDGRPYTKDEVLAYLRLNRPNVGVVVLEGNGPSDEEVEERADTIREEMERELLDDFDWSDLTGTATTIEEEVETENEVEVERQAEDDEGKPLFEDDGVTPVMETVTETETEMVTLYYPAVNGGLYKTRGGRTEWRRGEEVIEDAEGFEDEDDAQAAAEKHVEDLQDEDWIRERAYDSVSESVDYGEATRQARQQLESEGSTEGGRYSEYILDPEPEEDSYKEVFITAGRIARPTDPKLLPFDEIRDNVAVTLYGSKYADLAEDAGAKAEVDRQAQRVYADAAQPGFYAWKDGHDLYNDIENPIVRIRLDVREVEPDVSDEALNTDTALLAAGMEAEDDLKAQLSNHPVIADRSDEVQAHIEELRAKIEEARTHMRMISRLRAEAPRESMLFVEEVQPPHDNQQAKMPPAFVNNWREIAWKWILRHAVDQGYTRIGWTTGRQQVERYASIERFVEKVTWNSGLEPQEGWGSLGTSADLPEGGRFITVLMRDKSSLGLTVDGSGVITRAAGSGARDFEGQPIGAVIGAEIQEQIMGANEGDLSGKGLAIGGKGLARLYDKDFPSIIGKIPAVKKSGAKIENVPMRSKADLYMDVEHEGTNDETVTIRRGTETIATVPTKDAGWDYIKQHSTAVRPQPSLPIGEEMQKLVLGGQPLFQRDGYRPQTSSERELLQAQLDVVVKQATSEHAEASVDAYITSGGEIHVAALMVKKDARGGGIGSKVMRAVLDFADANNMQVALNQAPAQGKKEALRRFYSRLGFKRNGGRTYDPGSSGAWVRPPKQSRRLQEQGGMPRGAIQFVRPDGTGQLKRGVTISLFEKANLSTFLHESGHLYLELMGDLVERIHGLDTAALTPQQQRMLQDYDAVLRHLGVQTRDQIGREQHELFARSFEAYLFEGKAPSAELREAFARFRAWMVGIYRSLKTLNAPLSDDIRGVFDRMLATDAAIAEAQQDAALMPMFLTPDQAGMSPERFALYRKAIEDASTSARERLDRELLTEVQREQTEQWKARKAEVRTDVEAETYAMPVYQARSAITRGTTPAGESLVEGEKPVPMKLSREIVVATFGEERAKMLPRTLFGVDGADPSAVADLFGFSSADEMLVALAGAENMTKRIVAETDRRMLEEHGSLLLDGTLMDHAQAAVVDEQREAVLREELKALARRQRELAAVERVIVGEQQKERQYERRWFDAEAKLRAAIARQAAQEEIDLLRAEVRKLKAAARLGPSTIRGALPGVAALRDAARATLARTRVIDINPAPYLTAVRRASQAAVEAAARQDFDTAIAEKQKELINLALYREAQAVKLDVEKRVKFARETAKPGSMAKLMKAGESYHDQVAGVLGRFEFAQVSQKALERRAALWKWVQGMEAQGVVVELPEELIDESRQVNYRQLTVEELVGVTDGLKQLVHLARFKNRLTKVQGKRRLDALAKELTSSILSHKPTVVDVSRDRRSGGERKRMAQGVLASHRKLANLLREMDGWQDGGPMWNAVMRPLNEAASREADMTAHALKTMNRLIEQAYPGASKRSLYEKAFVPSIGASLSKMERIMVALNWGNEGNRDRIRRAEGWTDAQVQEILNSLTEADAELVQGLIDFIGSYWPQIAAKSMRVSGVRPAKVEALPFVINGRELPGGYFPLKYDDRLSAAAGAQLELETANLAKLAAFSQATTRRGHEQARAATLDQPVRLDFGVLDEHISQVIHDLSHHETLIDVGRILGHKNVQQAILEHYGDITLKTVKNTIRDVALGDLPARNAFERSLNHVRSGVTVVGLGWSLTTPLQQLLGFSNAVVRIGPKAMGRGLARTLGMPHRLVATVEWINESSAMMRNRSRTQQRELNEIRNNVGVYSGKLTGWVDDALRATTFNTVTKQGIADSYFYLIGKAQQMVDVPTWLGAYHAAIENGAEHDDAVALADQAVLDSQGGGQMKDLAEVQRGGPALKLFTNFYSAFSATYNQAVEAGKKTRFSEPLSIGRLAVDYVLLMIVPASAGALLTAAFKPGDDDEPLASWLVKENISYLMGMMIGLRELSGAVKGYHTYSGPAGARVFSAASRAIGQMQQGEVDEALVRSVNETAGIVFHYPAGQVWKTTMGMMSVLEGKADSPAVLVTGPEKE